MPDQPLSPSGPASPARPTRRAGPWGRWGPRVVRVAVLAAVILLVHEQTRWLEAQRPGTIPLEAARKFFPDAARVRLSDPERGIHQVLDAGGATLGAMLKTSPEADVIRGYSGPNDLLIALDFSGSVAGIDWVRSGDTPEHVERVRATPDFWKTWTGWRPEATSAPPVQAVSGATLTSLAIAEAIQLRLAGAAPSLRFPSPVTLEEARAIWTNAVRLIPDGPRWQALDAAGNRIGYLLRTSPQADAVGGYRGPTECLAALGADGRTLVDLRVRRSFDTESYVDQVRGDPVFLRSFVGRTLAELAALDFGTAQIEGVSGATQTSYAIAESLKRRAAAELKAQAPAKAWRPSGRDWVLGGVVLGSLIMAFTPLRGRRGVRIAWQLFLVGYVGLVSHDLLSLSLLQGWAAHGVAWRSVPGLALLAGAALVIPWTTRRQLYCHQVCPHGAAQQLLGGWRRRPWTVPTRWSRWLERIPGLLLAVAFLSVLGGVGLDLGGFEPFDAWSWRTAGLGAAVLALAGLGASVFVPQAYCRFGCPTGALLNYLRSAGNAERWGARDTVAVALLVLGVAVVAGVRLRPPASRAQAVQTASAPASGAAASAAAAMSSSGGASATSSVAASAAAPAAPLAWAGRTMGTTWSVKAVRGGADDVGIQAVISNELEWVESMISHWRPDTPVSRFNALRDTNAMAVPWPVLTLARWAQEVGRETGGALDVTVGPLVNRWGFGPPPRSVTPPDEAEVNALRARVGWPLLELGDGVLRKREPLVELDYSCAAEGWAIDHLTRVLRRRGLTNLLVEVGGEMRAVGRWPIAIEHPLRSWVLQDEAIATSGTYRQHRVAGGREVSHLIDPRTGRPVAHRTVSVSVRHAEAVRADLWATALNVLGAEAGRLVAERLGLAAQFVVDDGGGRLRVVETSAWSRSAGNGG